MLFGAESGGGAGQAPRRYPAKSIPHRGMLFGKNMVYYLQIGKKEAGG